VDGPWSVRWPRATVPEEVPHVSEIPDIEPHTWEVLRNGGDCVLLATGTMVLPALEASRALESDGIRCTVVNCRFLKPYDRDVLEEMVRSHPHVVTLEEGAVVNGFGAFMAREIDALDVSKPPTVSALGIPDTFIEHGSRDELLAELGLDAEGIAAHVRSRVGRGVQVASAS
jgi:1-deoxy-D-xylulose-5-phosphate synthase